MLQSKAAALFRMMHRPLLISYVHTEATPALSLKAYQRTLKIYGCCRTQNYFIRLKECFSPGNCLTRHVR